MSVLGFGEAAWKDGIAMPLEMTSGLGAVPDLCTETATAWLTQVTWLESM